MAATDIIKEFSQQEFSAVYITCAAADLMVCESSDDRAHIECRNVPEGSEVEALGDILRIKIKKSPVLELIFRDPFHSASCKVALPRKLYESFNADVGLGNAIIGGLSCESAYIRSGSCNLKIEDMKVMKMTRLESGVGNVSITNLESGPLEIRSGVGNVNAVNTITAGLDIQGGTGNILFDGTVQGNISVKGGVGDIDLKLHEDPSEHNGKYSLKTAHGIGKVNIEYIRDTKEQADIDEVKEQADIPETKEQSDIPDAPAQGETE